MTASQAERRGFVGRRRDLEVLTAALVDAGGGRGRLVVLAGEAGIGKTRLAEEVAAQATTGGVRVAWAGCAPAMAGRALWPWTAALRALGLELPGGPGPAAGAPQLVDELIGVLRAAAADAPVLVVLDDMQWADPASVELLGLAAPLLRGVPVLVVATVRSDAPHLTALRGPATVLELAGLDEAGVAALSAVEAGRALDPHEATALHRRTGGNPLFVRELARAADSGVLLPSTVRDALTGTLAELPAGTRAALEPAAVLDLEFEVDLVAAMLERAAEDVLDALEPAWRAGVLADVRPTRARFAHDLFRETVRDGLGPVTAARWHRRAALVLDRDAGQGGDGSVAARIVHHALSGGLRGEPAWRVARHALDAAEAAMRVRGYATAAADADRGLELLRAADRPDAVLRARLLLAVADARHALGDAPAGRAAYREAAVLAAAAGDLAVAGRAALGFAGGPVGFEVPLLDTEQITLLGDVLDRLEGDRDSPAGPDAALRARLAARLSVALTMTDAEPRRRALAADAVALARGSGDRRALAEGLAAHCDAIAGPEWSERRSADAGEVVRIGQALGDPQVELLGRRLRLVALLELGDAAGADAEIAGYARAAAGVAQPAYDWYVPLWRAMQAHAVGDRDRWAEQLARAEQIGAAAGSANAELLGKTSRFMSAVEEGAPHAVEAEYAQFPHDTPGAWVSVAAAYALAALGRTAEARARLDAAAPALPHASRDSEWLPMLTQAAEAVAAIGGHPLAGWLRDALAPFADRTVVEGIGAALRGSVHRYLGLLDAVLGRPADAAAHLAAAVTADTRLGAPLLAARAERDAAVLLGDLAAARRALARYTELGVPAREAELRKLLDEAGDGAGAGSGAGAAAAVPAAQPGTERARLRRTGEVWTFSYAGRDAQVRDGKGVRDLHRLLSAPGREVAAVDLAGVDGGVVQGDLGPALDAQAAAAYRRRLRELDGELAEADAVGDADRSARAAAEREGIAHELAAAYGLGGRARSAGAGGGHERARTAVRARIAYVIRKIQQVHPELGQHLRNAVHTGASCSYVPERPVVWTD